MGYYTSHLLNIQNVSEAKANEIFEVIKAEDGDGWEFNNLYYAFLDWLDCWSEECKAYDLDKQMIEFSKLYPEAIFIVEGDWEETNDHWKSAYKNWKTTSVATTMPELDLTLLD